MYNTEDQIDNDPKTIKPDTTRQSTSNQGLEALYQRGIACLYKNKVEEALRCLWSAVDFGYSRAMLPTIFLEIGSDIMEVV